MHLFAFIIGILSKKNIFSIFLSIILFFFNAKKIKVYLLSMLLGWGWVSLDEWYRPMPHIFPQTKVYQGKILSFRQVFSNVDKYLVELEGLSAGKFKTWLFIKHQNQALYPGEVYQWQGKWRPEQHFYNPGLENIWYQQSFRHIFGNCFSFRSPQKIKAIQASDWLHRIRVKIYQLANEHLQTDFSRAIFLTLILGVSSEMAEADWHLFKNTGVVHLMVISGAHLSLVIIAVVGIVKMLTQCFPKLLVFISAQALGSYVGLSIGLLYAILSGFGVPVQRAWLMVLLGRAHYFIPYRFDFWQSWRWSLFLVLIIEPHALYYPGTHLSFLAVAILHYVGALPWRRYQTLVTQLACCLGMGPLTLLWFKNLPLLGIFANLIAIPWVAYLVLPYAFILTFVLICGGQKQLTQGFDLITSIMHWGLAQFNQGAKFNLDGLSISSEVAFLTLVLLGLFSWLPSRRHALIFIFIFGMLVYPHPRILAFGEFWVDVLDVGQGLAVMVSTRHHHLLYDTAGMRGKKTFAELVILPYQKQQGIADLDKIVVSHPDLDHKAGLPLIQQNFPNAKLIVDDPKQYSKSKSCFKLPAWSWDGVDFHFIAYRVKSKAKKNNHSCVLVIHNQKQEVVLTGDVEKQAEQAIIKIYTKNQRNHFLLVPHHGSLTSSTEKFLKFIQPKLAVMSLGLNNAYHHPHPKIVARYHAFNISLLSTAELGMIRLRLGNKRWDYLTWR